MVGKKLAKTAATVPAAVVTAEAAVNAVFWLPNGTRTATEVG